MKSNATLTSVVMSLILGIALFTGMFIWMNKSAEDSNQTVDSKYSDVYEQYNTQTSNLNTKLTEMRNNFKNIVEPKSVYQVAINGLQGLGNVLLIPVYFIDYIINTITATQTFLDIPDWVKTLLGVALLAFLVLLIIKTLKGEQGY